MNKTTTATIKITFLLSILQIIGCCDAEVFTYNLDMNFSITENKIPVNNSFDLIIDIPDLLLSNEGEENDVSNLDFEFTLTSYNYSNDTTINYWDFEVSTQDLIVESERIENNETLLIGEPTNTVNGREMRFSITPTVRDTILLTIETRGITEGRGSCSPSHQLLLINDQLQLQNSDLNISQIGLNENVDNAVVIEVF